MATMKVVSLDAEGVEEDTGNDADGIGPRPAEPALTPANGWI
jgi:hypothetical protein